MKTIAQYTLLVLLVISGASISDAGAATYIRKDASTEAAKADLQALKTAMDKMKHDSQYSNCDNPLSWYYQGGMHWTPDPATLSSNPYCASYDAQHTQLKWAWNNCASHDAEDISEIHFLAWHRLYVYHLEKIVRKLSGKQDFALPYWNYVSLNSTASGNQLIMPTPFWSPADANSNSLYTAARLGSLNQGQPIGRIQNGFNQNEAKKLLQSSDYKTFNTHLNRTIHGSMHEYIGSQGPVYNEIEQTTTVGLMADIASAGFDPVFWMHHGNIDRLFQQWTDSPRGQKITMQDLNSVTWPYQFFDENGNQVTYTMDQVYAILYNLDYQYDDQKSAVALNVGVEPKARKETTLVAADINQAIPSGGGKFDLSMRKEAFPNQLFALNQMPAKSIVLELEVAYSEVPKGRYEVYVNLPKGNIDETKKQKHYAGAMHFFVAKPHPGQQGHQIFRFDLTDELGTAAQAGNAKLDIAIVGSKDNSALGFTVNKAKLYSYE